MIPAVLHQIWIGDEVPEVLEGFAQTWRELHPGWDYRLWRSPSELVDLTNAHLLGRPEVWVPKRNAGQFVSDVMRYEILGRFGGVYADMDCECMQPIDDLLDVECFASWESQDRWIGNAVLGSVPGARFMQRLTAALPWSMEINRGRRPNIGSGPQFLTKQYLAHPEELTVYEQEMFYPYSFSELGRRGEAFPQARSVHHWNNKSGIAR